MDNHYQKMFDFIRRVNLTTSDSDLRGEALDLITEISTADNIMTNIVGHGIIPIPKSVHAEISALLKNMSLLGCAKIDAIKCLRDWYHKTHPYSTLGLKEAKDTVDNWEFGGMPPSA
jgi:ribosomal protein L7/L12